MYIKCKVDVIFMVGDKLYLEVVPVALQESEVEGMFELRDNGELHYLELLVRE